MVRLEADGQVLALPRTDSTPCWRHAEHTQPTVVLGAWYKRDLGYIQHTGLEEGFKPANGTLKDTFEAVFVLLLLFF